VMMLPVAALPPVFVAALASPPAPPTAAAPPLSMLCGPLLTTAGLLPQAAAIAPALQNSAIQVPRFIRTSSHDISLSYCSIAKMHNVCLVSKH
jgi:hypothetical protein